MAKKADDSQNYQRMLEEAETIVREIGVGKMDLDLMVEKIERGYILIKNMRQRLDDTKTKIEKLRAAHESDPAEAASAED